MSGCEIPSHRRTGGHAGGHHGSGPRGTPADDLSALLDAPSGMHAPVWDAIMRLGIAGMLVAEEYGGGGMSIVDAAVVMEALGAVAAPGPFLGQVMAAYALAASEDQDFGRSGCLPC